MSKVLVVDDSYAEMQMIESMLKAAHHSVIALPDADHVEDLIVAEGPDVIVLDVVLPGRNGFQVCRDLRSDERFAHIPVVLCTSKGQESDKFWGKQQGANAHIAKPFTAGELLATVERVLNGNRRNDVSL